MRILRATLVLLTAVRWVAAEELRVGRLSGAEGSAFSGPSTIVDLVHPATISGSLTSATVIWTAGSPCSASVKLKFFRPFNGDELSYLGERGPFNTKTGILTFALSPPVEVQAGDLIGVAQLQSPSCGGASITPESSGKHFIRFDGDVISDVTFCDHDAALFEESLSAQASALPEVYGGTITGAGSGHGSNLNFKTEVQLANPGGSTIAGRLRFHPMGVSGSPSDPSIVYTLVPGQTVDFPDVVSAMGVSGLGSIDLLTQSSYPPLVVARVFNDQGAAGTAGFFEPLIRPGDPFILRNDGGKFEIGYFIAPADLTRFRMNFGIRSLVDGATVLAYVILPDGQELGPFTRQYDPNVFDQRTVEDFTQVSPIPPNSIVKVQVTSGSAIAFLVAIDETTGDASIQFGDRRGP